MFQLESHQKEFMDTFGYLHFPGLLDDRIGEIAEAFDGLLKKNGSDDHEGVERLAVVPFINHDPYLCTLLDDPRIQGIAAGLLGEQYQYWNSDGNLYVGDTRWHSDTQWPEPIRFFKMAIYLDPMTKDTGALRVIPGSHRFGEGYAETVHAHLSGKKGVWGGLHGSEVPAVAVETPSRRPRRLQSFHQAQRVGRGQKAAHVHDGVYGAPYGRPRARGLQEGHPPARLHDAGSIRQGRGPAAFHGHARTTEAPAEPDNAHSESGLKKRRRLEETAAA